MRVLRQAGLDQPAARGAYGALHTYTTGFATLEASRARQAPGGEHAGDGTLARQLAAYTTAEQFQGACATYSKESQAMPVPAQNTASTLKDKVTAVQEQTLRVQVTFGPAPAERDALCCQSGHRTHCIVQPANGPYLPAVLTPDVSSPGPAPGYLLIIYLAAGEAGMLFPPGLRFTIWADVLIGQTAQGKGLIGHGTTREQEPPAA